MTDKIRVVHYINQFYAGMGGEDTASVGMSVEEKAVGPGLYLQKVLGDEYEITATVICGDNYIAENIETVSLDVMEIAKKYDAQLFVAGPGRLIGGSMPDVTGLPAALRRRRLRRS